MKSILFILTIFALFSCNNVSDSVMPASKGKPGEVLIVMNKANWESDAGIILKTELQKSYPGLPQDEPLFKISQIPHIAFENIFKQHRNIIFTEVSTSYKKSEIIYQNNVYASPQLIITIKAKSNKSLTKLIKQNISKIINLIEGTEKTRLTNLYKKSENKDLCKLLEKKHGIKIIIPRNYKLFVDTNNFMWISYETPMISQGLLIYWRNYTDTSQFNLSNLLNYRDSVLKLNVPGPAINSYMTTDRVHYLEFNKFYKNKKYYSEIRGLWNVKGDFMGGPFINLSVLDTVNNRIVTLDGYVYAPKYDKHSYIRELEAILYSVDFVKQ